MNIEPITASVTVASDAEQAFRIFTEEMGSWWPLERFSRATSDFEGEDVKVERVEFQTRVGGRILEHMSNGRTLPWGEVLEWDPPRRFVLAWHPNASDHPSTEVEVRFIADEGRTRVELEHRGWERLGPDWAESRNSYASGWIVTLGRFRDVADEAA